MNQLHSALYTYIEILCKYLQIKGEKELDKYTFRSGGCALKFYSKLQEVSYKAGDRCNNF